MKDLTWALELDRVVLSSDIKKSSGNVEVALSVGGVSIERVAA